MATYIFECEHCGYLDSELEIAANHCVDNQSKLW